MQPVLLGEGWLTWEAAERRTDRYGFVVLVGEHQSHVSDHEKTPSHIDATKLEAYAGLKGKLHASVVETRKSDHIGDLFHGIMPETPEVGEDITLSETGVLVGRTWPDGGMQVGMQPTPSRQGWWLSPHALYRVHQQTVRLYFTPEAPEA